MTLEPFYVCLLMRFTASIQSLMHLLELCFCDFVIYFVSAGLSLPAIHCVFQPSTQRGFWEFPPPVFLLRPQQPLFSTICLLGPQDHLHLQQR